MWNELKRRNVIRVAAAYIVTAWLVIQVVETLFPVYGLSDEAIRLVVNILAIGLLPVLVFSWVFEWTPEGLKRDAEVDHGTTVSLDVAKRIDRIFLVVLALALGYFAFDKFVLDPRRQAELAIQQQTEVEQARREGVSEGLQSRGEASIAVLAFEDMSPGDDQEYISEGIAEDILNLLQRMPELDVRSRTSAFRFKDSDLAVPEIAEDLSVDHILEGSVRMLGDRIRITVQLIDARTDSHLWSENFDREVKDVFGILDEISLATAEQIGIELLSEPPRAERVDADAYFLFLRGNHLVFYIDHEGAADYFEQALAIEPDYIDALIGVSRAYWEMAKTDNHVPGSEDHDYMQKSIDAWNRARALDPDNPVLLAGDGWEAMNRGKYKIAARLIDKALSDDSKSFDVVEVAIIFSMAIRRADLAVRLGEEAVRRDPYCAACNYRFSLALYRAGRYAESESAMLRFWELAPGVNSGILNMAKTLMMQGKYDEALRQFEVWEDQKQPDPWWGPLMIQVLKGGDVSRQLEELEGSDASRIPLAEVAAVSGDIEAAFRLLSQASAADTTTVSFSSRHVNSNFFQNLHSDPRWAEIEERAGLADHQLAEIRFNPRLPVASSSTERLDPFKNPADTIVIKLSMVDAAKSQRQAAQPAEADTGLAVVSVNPLAELANTYWKLVSLNETDVLMAEMQEREAFLQLREDTENVKGFAGCNSFTGSYSAIGNDLSFGPLASTRKACLDGMETEAEFMKVLDATEYFSIHEETLRLLNQQKKPIARFEAVYFN